MATLLVAVLRVALPVAYVCDQVHSFRVVHQLWVARCAEEAADAAARRDRALAALFRRVSARCLPQDGAGGARPGGATAPRPAPRDPKHGDGLLALLAEGEAEAVPRAPAPPPPPQRLPPPLPAIVPALVGDSVAPFVHIGLVAGADAVASARAAVAAHVARWRRVSALRFAAADARSPPRRRRGSRPQASGSVERVLLD